MPFKLRKCPNKDLYWVVGPDGKHHSKEGMPRKTALAQKRILNAAMLKGGAECAIDKTQCAEANGTYYRGVCYNAPETACKPAAPPTPAPTPAPAPAPVPTPAPTPSVAPATPSKIYTKSPTLYTLLRMMLAAKKASPDPVIDGWHLQHATNDLKFYTKNDCGIVAIRGTNKAEDWATNSLIPSGKAEEGTRVQRDLQQMRDQRSRLASRVKYWYAVGHSLGGAICDIFIAKGLVKEAVSFNPAVETQYEKSSRNHRYYHADDPLYYFLAQHAAVAGVIPGQDYSWYDWASWAAPWTDLDYGALWAHKIERFVDFARVQGSAPVFTDWEMDMFDPEDPQQRRGRGTHKENVVKHYDLKDSNSLQSLSEASSVPLSILQEVYDRGIGAYKTQPTSVRLKHSYVKNVDAPMSKKLSKEQWAMARVYSFLDGNPKHDNDLRSNEGLIGSGKPPKKLANHLKELGISAETYLEEARRKAKAAGLASELLDWATDGTHKFEIMDEEGHTVEFGAAGMGDHILYTLLKDPLADKHRRAYLARARKIKGDWRKSPYSPNSLAQKILW